MSQIYFRTVDKQLPDDDGNVACRYDITRDLRKAQHVQHKPVRIHVATNGNLGLKFNVVFGFRKRLFENLL